MKHDLRRKCTQLLAIQGQAARMQCDLEQDLRDRIAELELTGYSLAQRAKDLGLPFGRSTVHTWLKGRAVPLPMRIMRTLATILDNWE